MESHNGEADELPPPPPLAPDSEPIKAEETKKPPKPKRTLVARKGYGKRGQQIKLCTNHFKVSLKTADEFFHHYYVSLHPASLFTVVLLYLCGSDTSVLLIPGESEV